MKRASNKESTVSIASIRKCLMTNLNQHFFYHNVLTQRITKLYEEKGVSRTSRQLHERCGRELQWLCMNGLVIQPEERGPFYITELGRTFMSKFNGDFSKLQEAMRIKAVRDNLNS